MSAIVLGIDPGHSGALAFYKPNVKKLHIFDMPLLAKGNSGRKEVHAIHLAGLLKRYAPFTAVAVMEDVGAMIYVDQFGMRRGQGAAASFAFGKSSGVVVGALAALGIKVVAVKPSVWKSLLNLSSDKSASIARAVYTFPEYAGWFARKKDDGRAEAALLAWLGSERGL